MEQPVDAGQEILERISALEVERARVEAQIAQQALAFHDLRRRQAEREDDPRRRDLVASFAADELAVALQQPTKVVQDRLAEARRVRNLMPRTWAAFTEGRVDAQRMSLIAGATARLTTNHGRIELDHTIAEYASARTVAQLRGKLNRFVARVEPEEAARRARRARAHRAVWVSHGEDGMSTLTARISTTHAERIHALLTDQARGDGSSDGRTIDQRRADAFVDHMLGDVVGQQSTSSRAVIGITIPVTSLAGLDDTPGDSIDGRFSLPAELVRDLAREPGTLFHRVVTDPAGKILDVTELGRFPSSKLRVAVDIRDGTCQFATCDRPALDSDLDHEIPHPRGPTAASNLRPLCRRHHNMKTHLDIEPTGYVMRARAA